MIEKKYASPVDLHGDFRNYHKCTQDMHGISVGYGTICKICIHTNNGHLLTVIPTRARIVVIGMLNAMWQGFLSNIYIYLVLLGKGIILH